MFCPECGKQVFDKSRFCFNCGGKLPFFSDDDSRISDTNLVKKETENNSGEKQKFVDEIAESIVDANLQKEMKDKINKVMPLLEEKRKTYEERESVGFLKMGVKKELDHRVVCINHKMGGIVTLGNYVQDYTKKPIPIRWFPIFVSNEYAILLSLDGLERRSYHSRKEVVTWEQSDIRYFLNKEFYNNAFSAQEKSIIKKYHIDDGWGKATDDFVFLLSRAEVNQYLCIADGCVYGTSKVDNSPRLNADWWLLRTKDKEGDYVQAVYEKCSDHYSRGVHDADSLIRPAICVSLN